MLTHSSAKQKPNHPACGFSFFSLLILNINFSTKLAGPFFILKIPPYNPQKKMISKKT